MEPRISLITLGVADRRIFRTCKRSNVSSKYGTRYP